MRQDTFKLGAFAGLGRTSPRTAVLHAVLIGDSVSSTVIGNAKVDLLGVHLVEPKETEPVVDFLQVSVRLDVRAFTGNGGIPRLCHVSTVNVNNYGE